MKQKTLSLLRKRFMGVDDLRRDLGTILNDLPEKKMIRRSLSMRFSFVCQIAD